MGVTPSLPPYAHIDQEAVRCVAQASVVYQVPELLMHSILVKEGGRTGQCSRNKDGSSDCGLTQINTTWREHLEQRGVSWNQIQNDACANIYVSAYILRTNLARKNGDWFNAIVAYNIGPYKWTPERYQVGYRYASTVVATWQGFQRWVDTNNPNAMSSSKRIAQSSSAATPQSEGGPLIYSAPSE